MNQVVKENLFSVNDFLVISNDNKINYIFLCELTFDEKILNEININKKINTFFFNDKCYKSIDSKLNEKSGIVQRGNLRSASNFISKGIYQ